MGTFGDGLHYDETGTGSVLVLLAGGAAKHPDYLGDLAGLSTTHRLVVPHLRGVGLSPLPDDVTLASFWRQADDLEALREHLGLERLTVVGHSAGTRLAIAWAAQHPSSVERLVLVTPPVGYLTDVESEVDPFARQAEPWFAAAHAAGEAGPATYDDEGFAAWQRIVIPGSYAHWGPVEQAHAQIGATSFAANRAFFSVDPPADLAARLSVVTAPVLVVAGRQDLIGVDPLRAVTALFPHGELAVVEDSAHFPWVEQPAAFRAAVDPFLSPESATLLPSNNVAEN